MVPTPSNLAALLRRFAGRGEGFVTALHEPAFRGLRAALPPDSDLRIEPFGTVVANFAMFAGELCGPIAPRDLVVAAIEQAATRSGLDSPFADVARFPGFHRAAAATLSELREWGLSDDEVDSLGQELGGTTGEKLTALADLGRGVRAILAELGREFNSDHVIQCLDLPLPKGESPARVLLLGGPQVTPLTLAWVRWATKQGANVWLVLPVGADGRPFEAVREVPAALGRDLEPFGEIPEIGRRLFAPEMPDPVDSALPETEIWTAADPLAEAEWALRRCLAGREAGVPWSRLAIVARDREAYAPLLLAAAERQEVPLILPRRAPLLSNGFARLILDTLLACAGRDVRALLPVVQSTYLSSGRESRAALEEFIRQSHREGPSAWEALERVCGALPTEQAWLGRLLAWRREAMAAHIPLAEWLQRLAALVHTLFERGGELRLPKEPRDIRANSALQRALANPASVEAMGEERPISFVPFADRCRALWTVAEVSLPTAEVGVTVAADPDELPEVDRLMVLGLLEGVFPRRHREEPILNDEDRGAISGRLEGIPLPTRSARAREEREVFLRVCLAPRTHLSLSYPQTDEDRDNVPAYYLEEVRRAIPGVQTVQHPREALVPAAELRFTAADRALGAALEANRLEPPVERPLSDRAWSILAASRDRPASPHEVVTAFQCPFRHLAQYRLGLRTPPRDRIAGLRSLPVRAGLVRQPNEAAATQALAGALESRLDEWRPELEHWELELLRRAGQRMIPGWVRREFQARLIHPRDDDTVRFDVPLGAEGTRGALLNQPLTATLPRLARIGGYHTATLFEFHAGQFHYDKLGEEERLRLGIYLGALMGVGKHVGVEIDGLDGKRVLWLLPRPAQGFRQDAKTGLQLGRFGDHVDDAQVRREVLDTSRRLADAAVTNLREGRVEATPGEACTTCAYGEMCRRSREFGEDFSPFDSPSADVEEEGG